MIDLYMPRGDPFKRKDKKVMDICGTISSIDWHPDIVDCGNQSSNSLPAKYYNPNPSGIAARKVLFHNSTPGAIHTYSSFKSQNPIRHLFILEPGSKHPKRPSRKKLLFK